MMKKKYLKYILSILLFLIIIYMTFCSIFHHNNINLIINNLKNISVFYLLISLLLICLYFLLHGIYMKRNMKILNKNISLLKGIFYAIVEFFFSGITPSSTGGQPVQLFYMNKDRIPKRKALITLLINTIFFKLIIVILGILVLIFNHKLIFGMSPLFIIFFFIGIVVDMFIVIGGYLTIYKQAIIKKLLQLTERLIRVFKKNYEINLNDKLEDYKKEVSLLEKHKKELLLEFIITFIQRLCLFSMSYIAYRALGLSYYNFIEVIIIQISVQTAIEFVPLPGGTGVSEYLIGVFFLTIFGKTLASTGMLITRTLSFYIPLILCGIVILVKFIKDQIVKKKAI